MTTRDKIGFGVILCLMALLCGVLVWTFQPLGEGGRGYTDNVFVRQRIDNLQK